MRSALDRGDVGANPTAAQATHHRVAFLLPEKGEPMTDAKIAPHVPLTKPPNIERDPRMSAKWDEITAGRKFAQSDAPTLALLCNWYAVLDQCMDDITDSGGTHVAYTNEMGDIKALPQLTTMKQASAEIRAINKQLGINDTAEQPAPALNVTTLSKIQARRREHEKQARGA